MMMRRALTWKKVSESSQSLLVSRSILLTFRPQGTDRKLELELDEEGTRISLTVVDTPGFGDQIDNEARFVTSFAYERHTY